MELQELEARVNDLSKRIQVAKDNPCHKPPGPGGGQFCETGGGGRGGGTGGVGSSKSPEARYAEATKLSSKFIRDGWAHRNKTKDGHVITVPNPSKVISPEIDKLRSDLAGLADKSKVNRRTVMAQTFGQLGLTEQVVETTSYFFNHK